MNRSQAVAAGVWYNPTPEQRRELQLRVESLRSARRRRVLDELRAIRNMLDEVSQ